MRKRIFHFAAILTLIVVCMFAAVSISACKKVGVYYLTTASDNWATYGKGDSVPDGLLFIVIDNGVYTLTRHLQIGDSFAIYKAGEAVSVVNSISDGTELTIDNDGKVTVDATGKYVLTVDVASGCLSYQFTAPVTDDPDVIAVTGVTLNTYSLSLTVGDADQMLTATLAPANAINQNVFWSTGDANIATVDNGVVHAVGVGNTTITVTTQDGSYQATCAVDVKAKAPDPIPVIDVTLSKTSLNMTVGDVDEVTVTIVPSNADEQDWRYDIEGDDGVVTATVNGNVISIRAEKAGTVTLIVAVSDNENVTASCEITVTEPTLPSIGTLDYTIYELGATTVVTIEYDDAIGSITATPATNSVVTATTNTSDKTVTLTSAGFGVTTVDVTVTYNGGSQSFTLNVTVTSAFFYIVGKFDGTEMFTYTDSAQADSANVLLKASDDGIYTLTRSFAANDAFFIVPATLGDNFSYALTKSYFSASKSDSDYIVADTDDKVTVNCDGNYTITLDIKGATPRWYVTVNYLAPTSVTMGATTQQIKAGTATTTATFLLETITPNSVRPLVTDNDITWCVSYDRGDNWLTYDQSTGWTFTVTLNSAVTLTQTIEATITMTVRVGDFTVETECLLTLTPADVLTGNITWEEENILIDVTADGWSRRLNATCDGTVTEVIYELVADSNGAEWSNVLVNDVPNTVAFWLENDTLTAAMFGTVWVKATAVDGSGVFSITSVTFYATEFQIKTGAGDDAIYFDHEANSTATHYEWKEIELNEGSEIVIVYSGVGDGVPTVIRSSGYLDSSSTNAGGAGGQNGYFSVTQSGIYDVTLDLSCLMPSVKFDFKQAIAVDYSYQMTVNVYGGNMGQSKSLIATETKTLNTTGDDLTILLTIDFAALRLKDPIDYYPCIDFATAKDDEQEISYNNVPQSDVNIYGTKFSSTETSKKWISMNSNSCQLWYDTSTELTERFTFLFTFDAKGTLLSIAIN